MTTQHNGRWDTDTTTRTGTTHGYLPAVTRNGMGVAALVLGILGVLTAVFLVGGLLGVVAIICGAVGVGRVNRGEATNRGMAITGIVLGVIAALITVGALVFGSMFSDEIQDLNACNNQATTQAERDACAQQFGNDVSS